MIRSLFPVAFAAFLLAACASPESTKSSGADAKAAPVEPAKPHGTACTTPPAELVMRDLAAGDGAPVTVGTAVLVHYTGWLYDGCAAGFKGRQFDSSVGKPTPFGLVVGAGRVIKGWEEGLAGMKEKGKRLLVIPPEKGYGSRGAGGVIPPGATLVFEVEMVKILQRPASQK